MEALLVEGLLPMLLFSAMMTPPRAMTPEEVELNCNVNFSESGGGSHRLHGTCLKCFRTYAENAAEQVAQAREEEREALGEVRCGVCHFKLGDGESWVCVGCKDIRAALRARRDEG